MPPQQGLLGGFAAGLVSLANFVLEKLPSVVVDIVDLSETTFCDAKLKLGSLLSQNTTEKLFVGITTTTASYQSALELANIIKEVAPNAITVLGGHHASAEPETILRRHTDIIDLIVIGEGERSLCELIKKHPILNSVPGIAFLNADNFIMTPSPRLLSNKELDEISIFFGDKGLIGTPGKLDHVTYVSARGCPLQCSFCAVGNDPIRIKSVEVVIREIERLFEMGYYKISLEDNFFAHTPSRTKELCAALSSLKMKYSDFRWDCQTRVESLAREETIPLLAEAGCEAVFIGVESLNFDHLRFLNKTKSPDRYVRHLSEFVVPSLLKNDIHCFINLQFGLPRETQDQWTNPLKILRRLGKMAFEAGQFITIFPQLYVVYPGTKNYFQSVQSGHFSFDVFESFTEWECHQGIILDWLGEHFAHGVGGIPKGILKPIMLKEGKFEIDPNMVLQISNTISAISRIQGIKIFNFKDHIITNDISKL